MFMVMWMVMMFRVERMRMRMRMHRLEGYTQREYIVPEIEKDHEECDLGGIDGG